MLPRIRPLALLVASAVLLVSCGGSEPAAPDQTNTNQTAAVTAPAAETPVAFAYEADRFADIRILRYQIPGFEQLSLQQKQLL